MTESVIKKNKEVIKIFKDLKEEVIDENICCACGACVAYCESQSFDVIEMIDNTPHFKSAANEENCTECGLCYFICPQTAPLLDIMNETYQVKDNVGPYKDIIAAKTTDELLMKIGQDGGVVTTILMYLFNTYQIDAAIVSEYDKELRPQPKLIFNPEELKNSAGTRYSISSQIHPLKDLYNIPAKILEEKSIFNIDQLNIAFVGTPCQVRALRKMKLLNVKPAHVVKYIISLFCFENFNYNELYDIFQKKKKIEASDIKKTAIKGKFIVETSSDTTYEFELKELDNAVRSNCKNCDEFTGRFSDISVGSSGAPEGYSMIITRTEQGDEVIKKMMAQNYITTYIPSQNAGEWKQEKIKRFEKMSSIKSKKK
ncbi:MAG: Coenzyme F420 hydrogenase subunit beta [Promethearchaeota archaeon]|nr:MAG: Coenzyme F420 hydrogenase subunit beta [Candidatus Lokiarchaeota archaeon]